MSGQPVAGTQEIEWQFDADDLRAVEHWLIYHSAGLGLVVGEGGVGEQHDTYYDTEDWRLFRAGYSLRLRRKGEHTEATLKSLAPAVENVRYREELTENLDNQTLEPISQAPGLLGEKVRAIAGVRPVHPIFELRTHRRAYALRRGDAQVGEVALDQVLIPGEDGATPGRFTRVEVELHAERDAETDAFVQELSSANRLRPAATSKYEEGVRASGLSPSPAPDLGPTEVDDTLATGEVAFRVLRRQFGAFRGKEAGVRLGEDPEEVHDMRVATRRMRAAMSLFSEALPADTPRLREELQWVATALGTVRDLDVQLAQLGSWRDGATEGDVQALGALEGVLQQRRATGRRLLLRTLNSQRYEHLLSDMTATLQAGSVPSATLADAPILAVAPGLVERRYRSVRRAGDRIAPESSPAEYHELRIKGKRLRYALEFVEPVYGRPVRALVAPLVALQDVLGRHQDAEVAMEQLRELTSGSRRLSAETAFVVGRIAQRYAEQAERERAAFPSVYGRLGGKSWQKLRRVMEKRRPHVEAPMHAEPQQPVDTTAVEAYVQ